VGKRGLIVIFLTTLALCLVLAAPVLAAGAEAGYNADPNVPPSDNGIPAPVGSAGTGVLSCVGISDPSIIVPQTVYDFSADAEYSSPTTFPGGTFAGSGVVCVVGSTWGTWNPNVYGKHILYASTGSYTVTFSTPQRAAGVVAEPNAFGLHDIEIQAYDSTDTLIGSFTRSIEGYAGAAFLGLSSSACDIKWIRVMSSSSALGFAFSDLTYGGSVALTGESISGVLNFSGDTSHNYFDPANGYVPSGSSGIQPNAVVADPDGAFLEFMFLNGFSGLNVDVDASTIAVDQFLLGAPGEASPWDIYLTGFDTDLSGIALGSSTVPGLTWSLIDAGHGLHMSFPGGATLPVGGWQATFNLGATNAPPVAGDDESLDNFPGPVTVDVLCNDSDPDGNLDVASVDLNLVTAGRQTMFTVLGEGVWTVDDLGNVTFTPEAGFFGDPTPIYYRVSDTYGLTDDALITITYLRALDLKKDAWDALDVLYGTLSGSQKTYIGMARSSLTYALNPTYWIDDLHLKEAYGSNVFTYERQCLTYIRSAVTYYGLSQSKVEDIIAALVTADRMLACQAIADALAACGSASKIATAQGYLATADAYAAVSNWDYAVANYRNAWFYAVSAY